MWSSDGRNTLRQRIIIRIGKSQNLPRSLIANSFSGDESCANTRPDGINKQSCMSESV